jgi:hypothetical protein
MHEVKGYNKCCMFYWEKNTWGEKKYCDVMIPNIYPLGITKKKWAFQKAKYSPFQRNTIMQ